MKDDFTFGKPPSAPSVGSKLKIAEVRVNKYAANLVGALLSILFCAMGVVFAHLLPRHVEFAEWHFVALLISLILLVTVHEALHAFALVKFAGVSWSDIQFGMMWRVLTPYCHCKVAIPLGGYRRVTLLPLWVTGAVTISLLLFYQTDWLGLLAGIAIAACIGDVWIFAKMRRFSNDVYVLDSPTEIGCDVYSARSGDLF